VRTSRSARIPDEVEWARRMHGSPGQAARTVFDDTKSATMAAAIILPAGFKRFTRRQLQATTVLSPAALSGLVVYDGCQSTAPITLPFNRR